MKTKLSIFIVLAVSTKFFGQISFTETPVVGYTYTTPTPKLVRAADFDSDGDLDIVTYGRQLNWYENIDGIGDFGEKKSLTTESQGAVGNSLYTVDLDSDGDFDILGSMNGTITLYNNTDGLGNFQVMQTFSLSSGSVKPMPVDMDDDGDLDIVCYYLINSGPFQAKIVWFQNNGAGSFGAEHVITNSSTLSGTSLIYVDDLDGDNDKDIIIGYSGNNGKITWLRNTGNNIFSSSPLTITLLTPGLSSIMTSDIDNDGDKDIIATLTTNNQVALFKNLDGLGTFSDINSITTNAATTYTALATNINNDNTVDIIYTGTNEIGWMSNTDGLGNFGNQQIITNKAFGVKAVIMADLDGDGKKDLISASDADNKVAWYKNLDGNGTFGRQIIISRFVDYPLNVYAGDFDGDNDIDLLVNSHNDAKLSWYENVDGLGFYGNQHNITENTGVNNIVPTTYPVDMDGDGDLDVVACKNSILFWYENIDGHGTFTTEHVIDSTSGASIIRSNDLDGDGKKDLLCGDYVSDRISWYKNLGNGIFGPEQVIADAGGTNGTLTSLEIADMDGDNDMDIIGASYNHTVYYYQNTNGLGNFAMQGSPVFEAMKAVYPADIDGDGDKDIVAVNRSGGGGPNSVVWYDNTNGLGNFSIRHIISSLTVLGQSISVADMDNDGDIDVLTAGAYGGTSATGQLAWYQNNGSGTFAPRQMVKEYFDSTKAFCVSVADVDNNNKMDVLAVFGYEGSTTLGKVSVFKNLGTTLSVPEIASNNNEFKIYPNPTTSLLNIEGKMMIDKISLFDINGRIIKEKDFNTPILFFQLDLTNLTKGIYLLKISSNQINTVKEIIKN